MKNIYSIIRVKCTPRLKAVLEGNEDYNNKSKTFDSLWLMK